MSSSGKVQDFWKGYFSIEDAREVVIENGTTPASFSEYDDYYFGSRSCADGRSVTAGTFQYNFGLDWVSGVFRGGDF